MLLFFFRVTNATTAMATTAIITIAISKPVRSWFGWLIVAVGVVIIDVDAIYAVKTGSCSIRYPL